MEGSMEEMYNKPGKGPYTTSYDASSVGTGSQHQHAGGSHEGGLYHPSNTPTGRMHQNQTDGIPPGGTPGSIGNTGPKGEVGSEVDEPKNINANALTDNRPTVAQVGDIGAASYPGRM